VTGEERKKITAKGRRWFVSYLKRLARGSLSEGAEDLLISTMSKVYGCQMKSNVDFFESICDFCSESRTIGEKDRFFRTVMTEFVNERANAGYHRGDHDKGGG